MALGHVWLLGGQYGYRQYNSTCIAGEQNEKGRGGGMDGGSVSREGGKGRMEGCEGGEGVWGLRPSVARGGGDGGWWMMKEEGGRSS